MKRTVFAMALAVALSLGFISGVMAQQTSPSTSTPSTSSMPKSMTSDKLERFSGMVDRVDQANKQIVVKQKSGKEMTFAWTDQTKFMEGKKDVSFSDLKEGMNVTVQYRKEGDKFAAERVDMKKMAKTAKRYHSEKSY